MRWGKSSFYVDLLRLKYQILEQISFQLTNRYGHRNISFHHFIVLSFIRHFCCSYLGSAFRKFLKLAYLTCT